jgi:nicotinamide phosphoribosyltransferase
MRMYLDGCTRVYSNFTPRSEKHSPIPAHLSNNKIVVAGTQVTVKLLKETWDDTFFTVPWEVVEADLRSIPTTFVGPSGFEEGIARFKQLHELGYLPVVIKAIAEGEQVPFRTPVLTITNTKPAFFWLVNYLETYISQQLWKPMTVATIAQAYRRLLLSYAEQTGAPTEFVAWQAHDFSARGLSNALDNATTGYAHLLSSYGTDSLAGVVFAMGRYAADGFIGGSVPATEHSVMTMGGTDDEKAIFKRILDLYPSGVVSIVSDSYDYWNVLTNFTVEFKQQILERVPDSLGLAKVVFRPDSGDPVDIICGTAIPVRSMTDVESMEFNESTVFVHNGEYFTCNPDATIATTVEPTPEMRGSVEVLYDIFGGTTNTLGYRTLNQRVGLIYGDSITLTRADKILSRLAMKGFASDNIIFGVGSYSYQMLTRDSFGFAMKATYAEVGGIGRELFKDPKTDSGLKKSARGLLHVTPDYQLVDQATWEMEAQSALQPIFVDGMYYNHLTFNQIRAKLMS